MTEIVQLCDDYGICNGSDIHHCDGHRPELSCYRGVVEVRVRKRKVYIASPYTLGDAAVNVRIQLVTAHQLMDYGFIPYTPLLSHFLHMHRPRPYEEWLEMDIEWLRECHYLLRLPGESKGADMEVKYAKDIHIPVFTSMSDLIESDKTRYPKLVAESES